MIIGTSLGFGFYRPGGWYHCFFYESGLTEQNIVNTIADFCVNNVSSCTVILSITFMANTNGCIFEYSVYMAYYAPQLIN